MDTSEDKIFDLGYDLGALVMKSWVPKPCGHISNASNYKFPVLFDVVEKSNTTSIHGGSAEIVPNILESEKRLEKAGCKSIFTSCGYFGHFQKKIANEASIPVYLSAVCLVPFIFQLIKPESKLGIICYNKQKLTPSLFDACGVKEEYQSRCIIKDVINQPGLCDIIKDQGHYDIELGKRSLVELSKQMSDDNPDMSAILLECTDLPPHSYAIQEATCLPVFDSTTMVNFIHDLMWNRIHHNNLPEIIAHSK